MDDSHRARPLHKLWRLLMSICEDSANSSLRPATSASVAKKLRRFRSTPANLGLGFRREFSWTNIRTMETLTLRSTFQHVCGLWPDMTLTIVWNYYIILHDEVRIGNVMRKWRMTWRTGGRKVALAISRIIGLLNGKIAFRAFREFLWCPFRTFSHIMRRQKHRAVAMQSHRTVVFKFDGIDTRPCPNPTHHNQFRIHTHF